ncbi:MAG: hypothetical protein ACFFFK_03725 [Candidatus Thorarchaeota archaeon]
MSRRIGRRTGSMCVLAIIVLGIGLVIAWLSGFGYLPFLPQTVVMLTMIAFCLMMLLSTTTAMAGTDYIARQNRSTIPEAPMDEICSRVIRDFQSGEEKIVRGHPNSSIQELLEDHWPFNGKVRGEWYVTDERGNDITNWPLSNWEGIATIRYSTE